ncbi:YcaO-like family protein [Asanoa iriomotensis]|uniref:Methanogenesis marker 1 protein n=1 Tax=Asanoa iriomotensis TaxID=234613 RepID=A0ABQ4CFY4_9ACTN|nr:YcaO-like family protein [Asanoa iriomotensis]GIF61682.1 methanogenesis marker 1 protein [Asanoa iriomotensis]
MIRDQAPKLRGRGAHRERSPEDTFAAVRPHFRRIGITRIADITGLDRIGIPVHNAIVPRSNDVLSVYTGKGLTPIDSMTSAVMEAVERYAGWLPLRPATVAAYEDLGAPAMRPADLNIELLPQYADHLPIYWVPGYDLVSEETVLVPNSAVSYGADPGAPPCYSIGVTNGLASGNTLEEAVCHALCELIERDALTLSEIVSGRLSHILAEGLAGPRRPEQVAALRQQHPHIDPGSTPPTVQRLLERFHDAGISMRLVSITSDLGIPSVLAASAEDNGPSTSKGYGGYGTHPDLEIAMIRAVTECAQSRAVDIQAMREDINLPDAEVSKHRHHTKRATAVDPTSWAWRPAERQVAMAELPSHPSDDVVSDIRMMVTRLRDRGMSRVIVVDLSPPDLPVRVARVVVPGLESWAVDRSKLGQRAADAWNTALRQLAPVSA